jgi:hypothetical protein
MISGDLVHHSVPSCLLLRRGLHPLRQQAIASTRFQCHWGVKLVLTLQTIVVALAPLPHHVLLGGLE